MLQGRRTQSQTQGADGDTKSRVTFAAEDDTKSKIETNDEGNNDSHSGNAQE